MLILMPTLQIAPPPETPMACLSPILPVTSTNTNIGTVSISEKMFATSESDLMKKMKPNSSATTTSWFSSQKPAS